MIAESQRWVVTAAHYGVARNSVRMAYTNHQHTYPTREEAIRHKDGILHENPADKLDSVFGEGATFDVRPCLCRSFGDGLWEPYAFAD